MPEFPTRRLSIPSRQPSDWRDQSATRRQIPWPFPPITLSPGFQVPCWFLCCHSNNLLQLLSKPDRRPVLQLPATPEGQFQYLISCPFASLLLSEPKFFLQSWMMNSLKERSGSPFTNHPFYNSMVKFLWNQLNSVENHYSFIIYPSPVNRLAFGNNKECIASNSATDLHYPLLLKVKNLTTFPLSFT